MQGCRASSPRLAFVWVRVVGVKGVRGGGRDEAG